MTQPKTTTKKGDRLRTPRSPFGLPQKRPPQESPPPPPPRPSKALKIAATVARLTVGSPSANPLIQWGRLQPRGNPVLQLLLRRSRALLQPQRSRA